MTETNVVSFQTARKPRESVVGYTTTGPDGDILRYQTARLHNQPKAGLKREGAYVVFTNGIDADWKQNMQNALDAGQALIDAGFQVDIAAGRMLDLYDNGEEDPAAYIEVWRDVDTDPPCDLLNEVAHMHDLSNEIEALVTPFGGDVDDAGFRPPKYIPHHWAGA